MQQRNWEFHQTYQITSVFVLRVRLFPNQSRYRGNNKQNTVLIMNVSKNVVQKWTFLQQHGCQRTVKFRCLVKILGILSRNAILFILHSMIAVYHGSQIKMKILLFNNNSVDWTLLVLLSETYLTVDSIRWNIVNLAAGWLIFVATTIVWIAVRGRQSHQSLFIFKRVRKLCIYYHATIYSFSDKFDTSEHMIWAHILTI